MPEAKWNEFFRRLEGPEGCNFQEKEPGNVETVTWTCGGGWDKSKAEAILRTMRIPDETASAVLRHVESLGGHCDCEILFNAVERIYEEIDREEVASQP